MLTFEEIQKHNTVEDLWVIVNGKAYDLTDFAPEHPGGLKILLKYAGKDATEAFEPIHPPGTLEQYLPKEKHLGDVDMSTVVVEAKEVSPEELARLERVKAKPSLDTCLSLYDFETVARSVLPAQAWAYYCSGADDEVTLSENRSAFQRIWFRPRILRNVASVDFSTTILGQPSALPVYLTATALGKLGHPDGEKCITWAAQRTGAIQMIPTLASCSFDEIVDEAAPGQPLFFQLYVNKDRAITERIVRHAEARGVKGLFITVDAPQLGRREKDMRQKFATEQSTDVQKKTGDKIDQSQGAARAISSFIDPGLCWDDITWFQSITRMPIVLKGVQCWEDAVLAAERGLAGVVLSNHGGRQLDYAKSGVETLVETVAELKKRGLYSKKFEIYVDGGIRRAGDVLKALALGATAVGIGRPVIYGFSSYGAEGVERVVNILKDELEMDLRLLGAPTLKDITPEMVDASSLGQRIVDAYPESVVRGNKGLGL